jgi:uncharacterized membrane protein YkoI
MNKSIVIFVVVISFVLGGLVQHYMNGYEGREQRIEVLDTEAHNKNMNACVAKALEKHPGALMEVELEKEDGRWVFDIDVQGKDGKAWDVECDINSAEIVEDSIDRD